MKDIEITSSETGPNVSYSYISKGDMVADNKGEIDWRRSKCSWRKDYQGFPFAF